MKIAKLNKVELREVWAHEAHNFTKWLAEPENLELLSDEIGIGLELVQVEANVGQYNVDILAREENTSKKIIIENQLETTNHSHLGQLITYAAGLEAEYIIWLVREAREEHQQAVDWLNEHTDDKLNFFLVEVELWQIGGSDAAVKFSVVSRPNDWKKTVMETGADGEQSETKSMQLDFWQKLREFAPPKFPELKLRKPRAQHWYDISIGRSDCHVCLTVFLGEDKVGCELYIPNSKELFFQFRQKKDGIEKSLGLEGKLDWQELPGRKASRIRTFAPFDLDDDKNWEKAFQWLGQTAILFRKAFSKNWNLTGQSSEQLNSAT
jgi:hypothetical protein